MKKFLIACLLVYVVFQKIAALDNSIFMEWAPEILLTDKEVSYGSYYSSGDIKWNGVFENGIGLLFDVHAGYLLGNAGSDISGNSNKLPKGFPDSVGLLKFGIGPTIDISGYGPQGRIKDSALSVILSPTINIIYLNQMWAWNATFGLLGDLFIGSPIGVSAGFSVDTPPNLFTDSSINFAAAFRFNLGLVYDFGRQERIEREKKTRIQAEVEYQDAQRRQQEENKNQAALNAAKAEEERQRKFAEQQQKQADLAEAKAEQERLALEESDRKRAEYKEIGQKTGLEPVSIDCSWQLVNDFGSDLFEPKLNIVLRNVSGLLIDSGTIKVVFVDNDKKEIYATNSGDLVERFQQETLENGYAKEVIITAGKGYRTWVVNTPNLEAKIYYNDEPLTTVKVGRN